MTLQERISDFDIGTRHLLIGETESLVKEFIDYWTEHSLNGKKFRAEKEKVFDIKKRFSTWKRNNLKWNPTQSKPIQMLNAHNEAKKLLGI